MTKQNQTMTEAEARQLPVADDVNAARQYLESIGYEIKEIEEGMWHARLTSASTEYYSHPSLRGPYLLSDTYLKTWALKEMNRRA